MSFEKPGAMSSAVGCKVFSPGILLGLPFCDLTTFLRRVVSLASGPRCTRTAEFRTATAPGRSAGDADGGHKEPLSACDRTIRDQSFNRAHQSRLDYGPVRNFPRERSRAPQAGRDMSV